MQINNQHSEYVARQATYHDIEEFIQTELAMVDSPPAELLSSKVENNPCITGVYVTRIKIKQNHRALEHKLMAAECWNVLLGNNQYASEMCDIWRDLTFSAFHDAITSTMCDDGYYELLDIQQAMAEKTTSLCRDILLPQVTPQSGAVTIFNHQGFTACAPTTVSIPGNFPGATVICEEENLPVYAVEAAGDNTTITFQSPEIAPLSAKSVQITPAQSRSSELNEREVQCGYYSLIVGEHGIEDVRNTDYGSVTDTSKLLFGEYRAVWNIELAFLAYGRYFELTRGRQHHLQ